METSWEKKKGGETFYASISTRGLEIGSHRGSGHTDSCGTCPLDAFLDGKYQGEFKKTLGTYSLAEARAGATQILKDMGQPWTPKSQRAGASSTGCWRIANEHLLVEAPKIDRVTSHDLMGSSEERMLLNYANREGQETGLPERLTQFARYYEVDAKGKIVREYEEYSYSYQDELYSWAYRVISRCLWKFQVIAVYGPDLRQDFSVSCVYEALEPAPAPEHILV